VEQDYGNSMKPNVECAEKAYSIFDTICIGKRPKKGERNYAE